MHWPERDVDAAIRRIEWPGDGNADTDPYSHDDALAETHSHADSDGNADGEADRNADGEADRHADGKAHCDPDRDTHSHPDRRGVRQDVLRLKPHGRKLHDSSGGCVLG